MTATRLPVKTARSGFTLIEIMAALTITAVVATVAASALHAGLDVRERVQLHRQTLDAEARATSWLAGMLRHAPEASSVNEAMLSIAHASGGSDVLTFLSRGVEAPLGTGHIYRITCRVFADGLHIHAVALNDARSRPVETVLPHVISMTAEALSANGGQGNSAEWRNDWPVLRTMPSAVRITLGLRDGSARPPAVFAVAGFDGVRN